jgi:tetratricopeptide (TPR) repeat protein
LSRHHKPHHAAGPGDLRPRVERARQEGRFQQALDLARQLHKAAATPDTLQLLKDCCLGRARQLNGQGQSRDAVATLEAAPRLDPDNPAWLEQVAVELAAAGGVRQALALLERLPGSAAAAPVLARAADAAVRQEAAGRALLPPALHADFDRVLQAFAQLEAGHDETARETLQGIGLRSPFAEWKLLLRGLQAYHAGDDARAMDNWQRLDPTRLPARLAAPLRGRLDAAFLAAQPPATQKALAQQFEHLGPPSLVGRLRALRATLDGDRDTLAPAFRQAEALLPELRAQAPHLVPRLANCFYWAVMETGPDDILRYKRVFGPPPDDPDFHRLRGLAYEQADEDVSAHREWLAYEKDLAAHPGRFPAGQADRARALVWLRMGRNAAAVPSRKRFRKMPRFLRDTLDPPRPLDPPAERCLLRAIDLAPDLRDAYEELFRHHREEEQWDKAEKAARRLLERFPDHVATLEGLADMISDLGRHAEALELLRRALHANPLDRRLRGDLAQAHLLTARDETNAGRFDEARGHYQAALGLDDPDTPGILARWAACEFKAGAPDRAEELLKQAREKSPAPLDVSYRMLIESVRLKLPRPLAVRFEKEFKDGLAAPPSAEAAARLASIAAAHLRSGTDYRGLKTHFKRIQEYAERACNAGPVTEEQLTRLVGSFLGRQGVRLTRRLIELGEERFPKSPFFPHLMAVSYFEGEELRGVSPWVIRGLLDKVERLAGDLPRDERRDVLLEDVADRRKILDAANPFFAMFGGMADPFDVFEEFEDMDGDDG